MRRLLVLLLVVLPTILAACSQKSATPSNQSATEPQAQTQEPSDMPKGQVLVAQLPTEAEGVELVNGSLSLKKGYDFVKNGDGTFTIARANDGRHVTSGGCGCTGEGGCDPVLSGGIIVCKASNGCTDCGLALTINGTRTNIIRY